MALVPLRKVEMIRTWLALTTRAHRQPGWVLELTASLLGRCIR